VCGLERRQAIEAKFAMGLATGVWAGGWDMGVGIRVWRTEAKPAVTRSISASALKNSSGLKSTMVEEPLDPG
jgi:hypothetical protein